MKLVRLLVACLVATASLATSADVALGHANYVRSDPAANAMVDAAPERVQVWFSEPVEPSFSTVQVIDATGRRVDRGDSRVAPDDPASLVVSLEDLEDGTYTVAWEVLSQVDGHTTRGVFSISVGVATVPTAMPAEIVESTPETPFEAALRWVGYLGLSAVAGTLIFGAVVVRPVVRRHEEGDDLWARVDRRLWQVAVAGWAALLVASVGMIVLQVAVLSPGTAAATSSAQSGGLGQMFDAAARFLTATRHGQILSTRLVLVVLLGVGLLSWRDDPRIRVLGGLVVSLGVMLTTSLSSHSAAAGELALLGTAADLLHLVAIAAWIGGLIGFVVALPEVIAFRQAPLRWRVLAGLVPRFSAVALASVATLVVTGLVMTAIHVGSIGALVETLYGRTLIGKLGLVALAVALGAVNLLFVRPRLSLASGPRADWSQASRVGEWFRRSIRGEVAIGVIVVLAAAVMTSLAPARQTYEQIQAARPLTYETVARDLQIGVTLAPARPGPNTATVRVRSSDGQPIDDAERVGLRLTYLDRDLGVSNTVAEPRGGGEYVADDVVPGVEGRWQLEVIVRPRDAEDVRTAFRVYLTSTSATLEGEGASTAPALRLPPLTTTTIAALALVVVGAALLVHVIRNTEVRSTEGGALVAASLAVIGLGIFLALRTGPADPIASAELRALRNPFPPTAESIAMGERIYREQCQVCHGATGRGDGPAAATLNPRPADFRIHMAAGHTDGELFYWVSEGVQGTGMPAFGDQLGEDERWHVINFIRTFTPVEE